MGLLAPDVRVAAEQRRSRRYQVNLVARLVLGDGTERGLCVVTDLSETGARLKSNDAPGLPENFTLVLSGDGQLRRRCRVAWRTELELGVEFVFNTTSQKKIGR
jgi:hypothetical protein